jgi:tRNA pseudouridine32 synthase/23S rRNA pseudouridine746 synthase
MNPPPSTTDCEGFCADCSTVHSLPVGNSRKYALELFHQLERHECLDFDSPPATRTPSLATSYLWGDARGQMFGVLECEDADGNTIVLKAFSCQYDGQWLIDGWVPPILDPKAFYELIEEPDKEINRRTKALQCLEKSDPDYQKLFDERKALSQQLMKEIHALYHLTNFRGEPRPLTELFPDIGIPTGVGECCAPKLLNHAALNGLKPLGLSEFYFGKESKSGERQHGQFYPACAEKCQPILGFMLCGTEEWNTGILEKRNIGNSLSEFQNSTIPLLHADDDIVVICKPSGLLSVPGKGPENQDCVVARVKEIFPDCPDHPEVHRLDMDTSGLMVLARTKEAHRELSRQFHDRETKKRYIALLDGELTEACPAAGLGDSGTIRLPFRLDVENRPLQIYDPVHGKLGITHWKVLSVENGKTRVELIPITGRTHQLRIHAASEHGLGVPILGDRLYGTGTAPGQLKLHASFLAFTHPRTGKKLHFTSAPPF